MQMRNKWMRICKCCGVRCSAWGDACRWAKMVVARSERQTTELKVAAPHVGANELGGSATAVRPAMEAGEDKIIRETHWARLVQVTVTEREKVNGETETCIRHVKTQELKEIIETREIEKVEERIHDEDGVKDEHTHMELARDDEGELGECVVTWCKQPDGLLMERGEGIFPLEVDLEQVGPVELCELEGASAVDGCTWSLGGLETPRVLEVTRFSIVNVPVCVFTSVEKCVLKSAYSVGERRCVKATPCVDEIACVYKTPCVDEILCVDETPCVDEAPCVSGTMCTGEKECLRKRPCVRETACVRSLYVREMVVGMRKHATACPSVNVMSRCVSVVARGSLCA
uniref:Uncharacterized protein n=1 Tax=Eptatretus burgeri TaxID=7764 RepID=A0A8C4NH12_EPTBU